MTTIAQLIEKLKTLPQDAVVEVLVGKTKGWNYTTDYVSLDIDETSDMFNIYGGTLYLGDD